MHNESRFTVGLIQMSMGETPSDNVARALERVGAAAEKGAQVICLPELFRTPYFCQGEAHEAFDLAEPIPGPTTARLSSAAAKHGVILVASLFERRAAGLYHNTAVVFDEQGAMAGLYRKMHIPEDPGFNEKFYFTPGDLGFPAVNTSVGRIGVLVCWDQWFPEAARLMALQGVSVLFYPTAIGWLPSEKKARGALQLDAWRTVQRGHAVANGIYVAAVNRVGHERPAPDREGIEFWGNSFVAGPQGELVAEAASGVEDVLLAEVDPVRIEAVRREWPFLRDRRVDAYGELTKKYLGDA